MKALLGIVPPDDRHGCLQDIHWYDGAFGYFPTYTLGAMTAAQLFDAAKRADPTILPGIGNGEFAPLMAWLRGQCARQGIALLDGGDHHPGDRPAARPGDLRAPPPRALCCGVRV